MIGKKPRRAEKDRDRRRIDVNELLDAIIAEAGTAKKKADFVDQIQNIRKISFLIAHRIWLHSTPSVGRDRNEISVLKKWCPECGSENCERVSLPASGDARFWICFNCRRRFV